MCAVWTVCQADTVVLRNGFRMDAVRHEAAAESMRLLTPRGGWIEVPAHAVLRVEAAPAAIEREDGAIAPTPVEPDGEFERLAAEEGVPAALVRAIALAESGLRQDAVSSKGALGIMQLLPGTAAEVGVDPHDRTDNLRGGARYLSRLLERFSGDDDQLVKALAAYNAGPARVAEHRGVPPYPETVNYVRRVIRSYLELDRAKDATAATGGTGR